MYPASITKVMTSLIAIKYGNLEDQVTVTEDAVISGVRSLPYAVSSQVIPLL
ncbi:MAG: hypothetical protein ACLVAV_02300 [Clostridium sp.]